MTYYFVHELESVICENPSFKGIIPVSAREQNIEGTIAELKVILNKEQKKERITIVENLFKELIDDINNDLKLV